MGARCVREMEGEQGEQGEGEGEGEAEGDGQGVAQGGPAVGHRLAVHVSTPKNSGNTNEKKERRRGKRKQERATEIGRGRYLSPMDGEGRKVKPLHSGLPAPARLVRARHMSWSTP